MRMMKKIIFLLFSLYIITLGLYSQSTGISGDSTINRCEVKSYTISLQNNSGNALTNLSIVARLENLVGFSYVSGTTSIDINGGGAFCTADPSISGGYSGDCSPSPGAPYLSWDLDSLCSGGPFTLNDGEILNITFQLETDCTAVSGSLNTYINYDLPGLTNQCDDSGVLNIQVNPGAVTIKKTPNVIPQVLGQNVTWTITIENTGFGVIENVEVTDVLGIGLAYVSSTQNGNNSSQTTTWTSNEYPALASMNPGDILTMDITATVIACNNLDNIANVRFGCNPSPTSTCFDTAVDGGTASASVQRIVHTPVLEFAPPNITFTYCNDTEHVSFVITNDGDGIAYDVHTLVDFGGFAVSNVSSGAIYNDAEKRFELADPLAANGNPGDSYTLSFDLTYSNWCSPFPSGDILWQKLYKDECDQEFYPPVEMSTINAPVSSPDLSVSKNGAGSVIQIGDPVTYTIASSYSGPQTCGTGSTSDITVVDTVPDGFTVTDAGGGVWVPGGGGTGGTITWTYTPPATLNTTVSFQSPLADQCETYCNTVFVNTIEANGTDCCGCTINATDSETTAIECAEGVTSDKTSTSPTERCTDTTYTNTYTFSAGSGVLLSDLRFEEHAELQQLYNGNLSVLLGAADITGCVAVTDNTPGGSLLLDFSGCASTSMAGQTVTITYNLTATANTLAACTNNSFYSWSSLDMGPSGSNCLGDGIIHETTVVSLVSPSMSLSITGLGQIFHTCESKTITMTITQTSSLSNPKDVKLVLSGLNYYVVDPSATSCSGVSPVSCTPSIDGSGNYVWTYEDAFTGAGQSATIQLEVQKRCTGSGDLVATAYFDDLCTDDTTPDELCSVVATETPTLLLHGDLLIEKTPEVYYAVTNQVEWIIYITNRGTGTAYNVWVDDVLGSGLIYEHGVNPAVVDNMTGVTVNDSLDHSGSAINGASIEIESMAAGERRQITFYAKQIDCNNLTNDVTTNWGCIGLECQAPVSDSSIVELPAPNLINTNTITPSGGVDACSSPDGFITLRNAGQITCYNLQVTETLPPNLLYISGSTRWRLNGGAWNGPNVAFDPSPVTSPLVWTSTEIPGLATSNPGDTIEIEFQMSSDCPFTGGNITCSTQYENPCANVFNTAVSTFTAAFNEPEIVINKTRANEPIDCNESIQWTITVTNNSGYTLPLIWIEDTMDASFTYVSSVGDPPFTSDNGTNAGQVVTWELRNVNHGDTVTLTLNATTDSAPCSPDMDNTVIAYWGCGLADGSSSTKPGVDAPDNSLCLTSTGVSDVRTETRRPSLGYLSIAMDPVTIDSCNDSTEITIAMENTGPVDAYTIDLAITLPSGITFNTGTAQVGLGTDIASATAALGAVGDPSISGSVLTFYDNSDKGNNIAGVIQAAGGNDTLVLRFSVQSSCYTTANVGFSLRFYDCCDDTQYTASTQQQLTALFPDLSITKTANPTQVNCGSNVEFTIQVTNNGTGNAEVIRVVDTLGDWLDYAGNFTDDQSGTISPAIIGGNPQVVGWEFTNLAAGATATFTFEATLNPDSSPNQADCAAALRQNNVTAQWACGTTGDATDDNPNTTSYDCSHTPATSATAVTLPLPNLVATAITPNISCSSDGSFSGTITVTVQNQGTGNSTADFTVQMTDGKGWTGTGTHSGTIAANSSVTVTINTSSWTPACHACASPYTLNATVDLNNDVCECNESDNTYGPQNYTAPIPDLVINSITPSCSGDGLSTVQVNIENVGCVNITSAFTVRLQDDQGHSQNVTVNSLNAGSSTNVSFTNWATACSPASINFTAIVDYNNDICECSGDNTANLAYTNTSPDLVISSITPSATCTSDGSISGTIQVQVTNNGNGPVSSDFQISINDGQGWSTTLLYNANLGGTLPLGAGASDTVTVTWSRSFTGAPYVCSFPSISVSLDTPGAICECTGGNNTGSTSYNMLYPNLRILSVTPTCSNDGSYSIQVVVDNNGCAAANGVVVQLADNDGQSQNQNVNLNAGAQQTLTFSPWPADGNPTALTFTATIDPSSAICELTGTDNSANTTFNRPNLELVSVTPSCLSDDTYQVSLVIGNTGTSAINSNFVVRLSDNDGHTSDLNFTAIGGTLPLNAGTQQTVVFNNWTVDCNPTTVNFTGTLDPTSQICESISGDNTNTGSITLYDLEAVSITPTASCSSDGNFSGSIDVTIRNSGGNAINNDFRIAVNDGQGWNAELWYQADLSGTLPLNSGASETVTFNWNRSFTTAPYVCSFPSISVNIDSQGDICECRNSNNSDSTSYTIPSPNLRVISITPACTGDGNYSIQVVVDNNGCAAANGVVVQLADNDGHSQNQTVNIGAGAQQTLTFTPWPADGDPASLIFTATIDPSDAICELSGSDNSANVTYNIPNLELVSTVPPSTLTPECLSDGTFRVSLLISNTGSAAINNDFEVRLTDNDGHTSTQNFTTLGGTLPFNAGTQQTVMFNNWVVDCNPSTINLNALVDSSNQICESRSGDNTDTGTMTLNDIEAVSVTAEAVCASDGNISGTMTVSVSNSGGNAINNDFRISVTDGQGWSSEQWYQADLGGTLPLAAGATVDVVFNWTRDFTATPYICNFPAISTTVDSQGDICECTASNNQATSSYTLPIADLTITAVASTIECLNDGSLTGTTVTVSNTGCSTATGVVVRLASDCGLTFNDQTITLSAGETQDVFFPFTSGITTCACTFSAVIDPDDTVCELSGANNTGSSFENMIIPDLEIQSENLVLTCLDDGVIRISGTVTLVNNGCGTDFTGEIPMRFALFNRPGCTGTMTEQWTQTFNGVSLPAGGGSQTFTIQTHDINLNFCSSSTDCQVSMLIEADYNNTICEWDGTDNTYCTNKTSACQDLEAIEIVPSTNCSEDASLNGTIAVTLRNSGGNPITQDFYIHLDDGQGWNTELRYHADLGGTLPLPGGATETVTITWNRSFSTQICEYTNIMAQLDARNEICQCTTDNDTISTAYTMPLPNLVPSAVTVSCSTDGYYKIEVTVENDGCSDSGSFNVHLSDNLGKTGDFTVDSLAQGVSTVVVFDQWPATCDPDSVTFTAVVDSNNDICEITGTDNTMQYVYTNTSPDLIIADAKPSASCRTAGDINGTFEITLQNGGNGPVTEDFKVIVNDGEGWSTELYYNADLNGALPIAAGETVTLQVNWNREFNKEPFKCDFNNITISLDMQANICECAAANNDTVTTYKLPYPDLSLQSLLPLCTEDGQRSLQLTVGNNGCEDQRDDFNLTFSDSAGHNRTVSFTALGGTLPLRRGTTQTINLANWEFTCTGGMTEYTASLNFSGGTCDLISTNNSVTINYQQNESDLLLGDITWVCNSDGTITFTVTVRNQGYGDAIGVPIRIYDGNGNLVHSRNMDLPDGVEAQFTFTTGVYPQGQAMTFRFVVDEDNQFCECDGTNNEKSTEVRCEGGGESQLQLGKFCPPGQEPGGLFRFEIQIRNTGTTDLKEVKLYDFLPDGLQYVPGSSVLNEKAISDPQVTERLTWTINILPKGAVWTLIFAAVADADIDPGRYCNEALAEASIFGDEVTIKSDQVQCCTVVTRQTGAGCCLRVEEWPMGTGIIPDGPLSFIEPYFNTEYSMFTVYSIFNLWETARLEKGSMPLFMKERMQNYARSTMEEFYLRSKLGLILPDGTLWLSYAGAYPERGHSWLRKQVDETMTPSQLGFELLALNEAVKIEERPEYKQRFNSLIQYKLSFLNHYIDDLPHAWEIAEEKKDKEEKHGTEATVEEAVKKYVKVSDEKATLYDKAALYLAMVELKNNGNDNANIEKFAAKLRDLLKSIDNTTFDKNHFHEEMLFILSLNEMGQKEQVNAKINRFESIVATESTEDSERGETGNRQTQSDNNEKSERKRLLETLYDYALAAAVDLRVNGAGYDSIMKRMKDKFYLKDTGVYAEVQPDFTFKLKLSGLAPLVLAFDSTAPEKQEQYATVLYRTFDEVGLFLKKRNLSVGKPLYSMLKNYPYTEPLLPVLNFTKANRDIAPVFSQDAVIHSTQLKPIGEILIPANFSKILSPAYETSSSRIAALSYGLQVMGRVLNGKEQREIKEEGRSLRETGESYVETLLLGGAGIPYNGFNLLPYDRLALKGPKKDQHNLEPLDAGTGAAITTETFANYLLAESYYLDSKGKYAEDVRQLMGIQAQVVEKFKETGYVPEKFNILIEESGNIILKPSKEKASKLTVAGLYHVLANDGDFKFLEALLKNEKSQLKPEDLLFFNAAPEMVPFFSQEIKEIVEYRDSKVTYNAADVVGRRLLGEEQEKIEKSLENLQKHWDKEAFLPESDNVENIEKGLIYHHDPRQFLLYLAAMQGDVEFRFERTLNFFTYLLENEWGVQWNSFLTLPSAEYQVFREEPKENAEPGDLLTFRVRVDNTCPEGYASAHDLPSLYLKSVFSPSLIYAGTQRVDGLDVLGNFKWYYNGLTEGSFFEYIYQAIIPDDFNFSFVDGWIYAGGRQGFEAFGPESAVGDECEDIYHVQRLNVIPFQEIQGLVYEDKNLNNVKDVGERGIANILIKDTRGRLFRSDAEGRFTVLAGDQHEGLQIELKSIPGNYLMIENPTKLVNRHYVGEVYFGLIPCTTVTGFVYVDENGNNTYDDGETRPEGITLKSKDKEELSGKEGRFIFRNLPVLWKQWIEVKPVQLYYNGSVEKLKIELTDKN